MKQAFHIFKKDVRYLRFEIAITLFFVAAFTISGIRLSLSEGYIDLVTGFLLPLGLPLVAWYLIARLIHAETLPGDRQFWITRPYRWQSLLGAKVLFVLVFLNVPTVIADVFVLRANGFSIFKELPGLIFSQILITAAILLPMMALAAVTTGLVQVLLTALILGALAITRSLVLFRRPPEGPTDWISSTIAISGITIVAACVIVWQYSRRRTGPARAFAAVGFVGAFVLSAMLPVGLAFWIQSRISNRIDTSQVQIGLGRGPWVATRIVPRDERMILHAPIEVTGIPSGMVLRPDQVMGTVEALNGEVWKFDSGPWSTAGGQSGTWPGLAVDGAFFEKIRSQPIRVRLSAFATLYGNERQTAIPYDLKRVAVPGAGLCTAMRTATITHVTCRYPFRNPPDAVTVFFEQTGSDAGPLLSYSPFPAQLDISPVNLWDRSVRKSVPTAPIVVTAEPLAHIRRDFEIQNLRLSDIESSPGRR